MAASRLRSLPRNVTDVTRILACVDGAVQNVPLSANAESLQLERTTPVREFCSWPGKRNYEGLYWSSTNRSHVDFESLLEREYLLAADAADDIVAIAAQPLALLCPEADRAVVKASAKRLLSHIHDKVVLDWRRKAATAADVKSTIRQVLDETLPADPYPLDLFNSKVQAVFDHFLSAYGDDGSTVYRGDNVQPAPSAAPAATLELPDLASMSDEVIELIRTNEEVAARVADELHRREGQLRTIDQLIENDEDFSVEFKSTARWDLRESRKKGDGGRRSEDHRGIP